MAESSSKPEADFKIFLSTLALEAKNALDPGGDEESNSAKPNLSKAYYMISILKVIQEKTRGNLTQDENQLLDTLLDKIQNIYNQIEDQATSL
ncbi:MAG: DUF1844 domain-containing protein [Candidatus Omnitrophica bacterium]|nr:DUF1844 domain-containing protein [Candidatus Omnitrophota bacterium]